MSILICFCREKRKKKTLILEGYFFSFCVNLLFIKIYRYIGSKVADFHRTLFYGGILIFAQKEVNILEA